MQLAHVEHPANHWNQPTPYGIDEITKKLEQLKAAC